MDDIFQCAVESLLNLYGSEGEIRNGTASVPVKTSPLISTQLKNERKGAVIPSFSANVMIVPLSDQAPELKPESTRFFQNNTEYRIQAVSPVVSSGKTIAFELEIRR